jgi:muramoyltetrapeptide carboxypeptidase LdcA involved in peptidoglycan recycling
MAPHPTNVRDTVFLIAPSSPTDEGTVRYAEQIFSDMGFKTTHAPDISTPHFNWSNTAQHRAAQIIEALYDPSIKAIYALEGGEGASEVAAELKKPENMAKLLNAPNRGIALIGGSDITFLHHFLGEHGVVTPVQGPVFSYLTDNKDYVIFENGKLEHVDLSKLPAHEAEQKLAAWEKEGKIISRPRSDEHAHTHKQNAEAIRQLINAESAMQSFELSSPHLCVQFELCGIEINQHVTACSPSTA